jgi:hypothetical protein
MSISENSGTTAPLSGNRVPSRRDVSAKTGLQKTSSKATHRVRESEIIGWLGSRDFVDSPHTLPAPRHSARDGTSSRSLTDDEILARATEQLTQRNIPSFARIDLGVEKGVITVRGNVTSKGEQLLVIHLLNKSPGVRNVINGITISRSSPRRCPTFNVVDSVRTTVINPLATLKKSHVAAVFVGLGIVALLFWPRSAAQFIAVHPVKGRVLLEGVALPKASVVLHPVGSSKLPQGISPRGTAKEDGGFAVATFAEADGAPDGEFIATVHLLKTVVVDGDPIPGPNVLPVIYSRPETSPFRVNITRETKELAVLELRKTRTR